jgi:glutamate-1-semialdehyde 2,1-aminomutase
MTRRLNLVAKETGQNMVVQNVGSMFHPVFTDLDAITGYRDFCGTVDLAKYGVFSQLMRDQGIFFSGNKILHNLSCTEHTQSDIDVSIEAAGKALEQMAK